MHPYRLIHYQQLQMGIKIMRKQTLVHMYKQWLFHEILLCFQSLGSPLFAYRTLIKALHHCNVNKSLFCTILFRQICRATGERYWVSTWILGIQYATLENSKVCVTFYSLHIMTYLCQAQNKN